MEAELFAAHSRVLAGDSADRSDSAESQSASVPLAPEVVDPTGDESWDKLAERHPHCTPFHSAAWARILNRTYGHKPVYLRFRHDGEVMALVPIMEVRSRLTGCRGVSLPFSDLCNPLLWNKMSFDLVRELSLLAAARRWKYCEVRSNQEMSGLAPARRFFHHYLNLDKSSDEIWQQLPSATRRAVRRAIKLGGTTELATSPEAVCEFYNLHSRTRRRHGLPPQPLAFFLNIHHEMIRSGDGVIALVRRGREAIAAVIFLMFGRTAVYKFAASDERYQNFRGNNLALWEGINFLLDRGYQTLDLGRTDLDDQGLRRFKLAWGAKEDVVSKLRCGSRRNLKEPKARSRSQLHKKVFARLPLILNRAIGAALYPHLD